MPTSRAAELACGTVGPWVKTSPSYETQVTCNRVRGHDGPHRQYSPGTFAVLAEWTKFYEPDERERRKVEE